MKRMVRRWAERVAVRRAFVIKDGAPYGEGNTLRKSATGGERIPPRKKSLRKTNKT